MIAVVWNYILVTSLTLKTCKPQKRSTSFVIRTRDTKGHAHGHVTLTYKVTHDSCCVELYIFDISDPKNLQNKKKIISLASLEPVGPQVSYNVSFYTLSVEG